MSRLTMADLEAKLQRKGLKALIESNEVFLKFMFVILEEARIYDETHAPGRPDTSAYMEGRRSLGLLILNHLRRVEPRILSRLEEAGLELSQMVQSSNQQELTRSAFASPDLEDESGLEP